MALEFKERWKGKRLHGRIKGIELPKNFDKFTQKDKKALVKHNPFRKDMYFKIEEIEQEKQTTEATESKE